MPKNMNGVTVSERTKKYEDLVDRSAFVETSDDTMLRIDFYDDSEIELHAHDEDSDEAYVLDLQKEEGLVFYGLQQLNVR